MLMMMMFLLEMQVEHRDLNDQALAHGQGSR
jgi:hypothetical protein